MKNLAIICARNPTDILLRTIIGLNEHYSDFDIVIIDSNSEETDTYDTIKKDHPHVNIHFIKNKNYEFGAYKAAYKLYPNYDIYMCLQDAVTPLKRFPFEEMGDNDVCHLPHYSGLSWGEGLPTIKGLLKGTEYHKTFSDLWEKKTEFSLTTLNFFVVKNPLLKKLIETLPNLPKDKTGSCSFERVLSICFIKNEWFMIPLNWSPSRDEDELRGPVYFHKEYFNRQ